MDELSTTFAQTEADPRLQVILQQICVLTGMQFVAVAYVSDDRWICCQVEDALDFGLEAGSELDIRKTICDEVRTFGKSIWFDNCANDPAWWDHSVPVLYGFKSYFALPIELGGQFFGTLCGLDPQPRVESIGLHLAKLELFAAEIASLLIENGWQEKLLKLTGSTISDRPF